MKTDGIDPLWLLLILGPLGSFAGLAALLRSGQPLTRRAFFSALLNSALFSIVVAVGVYHYFGTDKIWLVIGLSILSGLGGVTLLDFTLSLLREALTAWAKKGSSDGNK